MTTSSWSEFPENLRVFSLKIVMVPLTCFNDENKKDGQSIYITCTKAREEKKKIGGSTA